MKKGDKVRLTQTVRTIAYTISKGTEGEVHQVLEDDVYLVALPTEEDSDTRGLKLCIGRQLEAI